MPVNGVFELFEVCYAFGGCTCGERNLKGTNAADELFIPLANKQTYSRLLASIPRDNLIFLSHICDV
jgi:hypothetical protein